MHAAAISAFLSVDDHDHDDDDDDDDSDAGTITTARVIIITRYVIVTRKNAVEVEVVRNKFHACSVAM